MSSISFIIEFIEFLTHSLVHNKSTTINMEKEKLKIMKSWKFSNLDISTSEYRNSLNMKL